MGVERGDKPPTVEHSGRQLVYLAAERTLLTWIRTAIGMMLLGFAVDRFGLVLAGHGPGPAEGVAASAWIGVALIATGILTCCVSAARYLRFARRYAAGDPRPGPGILLGVALCGLLVVVGAGLVSYVWLTAG